MSETIELLSSSPPGSPLRAEISKAGIDNTSADVRSVSAAAGFGFDDFDDTGDISFLVDRPAKRRRISPALNQLAILPHRSPTPLDLSSEPELPYFSPNSDNGVREVLSFSSSAPELSRSRRNAKPNDAVFDLSSDSLPEDPFQAPKDDIYFSSQPTAAHKTYKPLTSLPRYHDPDVIANDNRSHHMRASGAAQGQNRNSSKTSIDAVREDIEVSSPPKASRKHLKGKATADAIGDDDLRASVAEQRNAAKEAKKAEKEAEKAAEKERKRLEKEQRAKDKQVALDKAEVNKSKINKNDTTSNMIVEMTSSFQGSSVGDQVEEYMKELDVPIHIVNQEVNLTADDGQCYDVRSIIRWKRKVKSEYDKANDEWLPLARERVEEEKHTLLYLKAVEFISILTGHASEGEKTSSPDQNIMRQNIDLYLAQIRSKYNHCVPILLVEGLDSWLKKNANSKNRDYATAVRAQAPVQEANNSTTTTFSSQAKPRKRKKPAAAAADLAFVTIEAVEEVMLHLHLNHLPIIIQHTTSATMSAAEIMKFTQHLSTRPGRLAFQDFNIKSASFCMESGQIKTGDDVGEAYVKMLQVPQLITMSMAYGIAHEYDSIQKLIAGFREHGNLMLEDVRKSTNKDGGWSTNKVGQSVSRRLFKIFMSKDPASTDAV